MMLHLQQSLAACVNCIHGINVTDAGVWSMDGVWMLIDTLLGCRNIGPLDEGREPGTRAQFVLSVTRIVHLILMWFCCPIKK